MMPLQKLMHEQVYVLARKRAVALGSLGIEMGVLKVQYTVDTHVQQSSTSKSEDAA